MHEIKEEYSRLREQPMLKPLGKNVLSLVKGKKQKQQGHQGCSQWSSWGLRGKRDLILKDLL